jgi:hypothetical protein
MEDFLVAIDKLISIWMIASDRCRETFYNSRWTYRYLAEFAPTW